MESENLNLTEIIKFIQKRIKILIIIIIISLLLGLFYTFILNKPKYKSNVQILIDKADASIETFIESKDVINNENIIVKFDKSSKLISAEISTNNSNDSFNILNKYIENLETKLTDIYGVKNFKIIENPQIATKADNINYLKDIGIFLIIGMIVYILYIFVKMQLSGVMTSNEIENVAKINVLGKIELEKEIKNTTNSFYDMKKVNNIKEINFIKSKIELNKENKNPKVILFTSTDVRNGNTFIVNNIAKQYAKEGNNILIVDTDNKKKKISKLYKIESQNRETVKTNIENISVLSINEKNDINDIEILLTNLKEQYDYIFIDGLPILKEVESIYWASKVDSNIIIAEYEKTKIEDIIEIRKNIEFVDGKISGVILNKI